MASQLDITGLEKSLEAVPGLHFAILFGSAREGALPRPEADVDVAIYLNHVPDLDERLDILGRIQDVLRIERVDVVFLNVTDNATLQREVLYGRLLACRDPQCYAAFFSLADRRGRDERARIARAWALRRELRAASTCLLLHLPLCVL